MLDGVLDQVGDGVLERRPIAGDSRATGHVEVEIDPTPFGQRSQPGDGGRGDDREIDHFGIWGRTPELRQLLTEPVESIELPQHDVQRRVRVSAGITVGQIVEAETNRRQRRPQLV